MNDNTTIGEPVLKLVSVWAAVGITSWADAASALAAIYTAVLLGEWVYKKFIKHKG